MSEKEHEKIWQRQKEELKVIADAYCLICLVKYSKKYQAVNVTNEVNSMIEIEEFKDIKEAIDKKDRSELQKMLESKSTSANTDGSPEQAKNTGVRFSVVSQNLNNFLSAAQSKLGQHVHKITQQQLDVRDVLDAYETAQYYIQSNSQKYRNMSFDSKFRVKTMEEYSQMMILMKQRENLLPYLNIDEERIEKTGGKCL